MRLGAGGEPWPEKHVFQHSTVNNYAKKTQCANYAREGFAPGPVRTWPEPTLGWVAGPPGHPAYTYKYQFVLFGAASKWYRIILPDVNSQPWRPLNTPWRAHTVRILGVLSRLFASGGVMRPGSLWIGHGRASQGPNVTTGPPDTRMRFGGPKTMRELCGDLSQRANDMIGTAQARAGGTPTVSRSTRNAPVG